MNRSSLRRSLTQLTMTSPPPDQPPVARKRQRLSFRPAIGRVVLVLLLTYVLLIGGQYYGLVLFPLNILSVTLLILVGGLWVGWRLSQRRAFVRTAMDGVILVGLCAAAISAAFSMDAGRSAGAAWLGAVWACGYWMTADALDRGLSRRTLGRAIYIVGLTVIGAALWQVSAFWRDWLALGLLPQVPFRVIASNPTSAFLNFVWPLFMAEFLEAQARWIRVTMVAALVAAGVVMLYTASRGGWLGMVVGGAAFIAMRWRSVGSVARRFFSNPLWRAMILIGSLALAVAVGMGGVRQLQHSSHSPTLSAARGAFWATAWNEFLQSPFVGRGLFTYASLYMLAQSVPPEPIYNQAHSLIFNLLAETGLVGLAAFGAGLIALARVLQRRDSWQVGAVAGLSAALAHGMFETPYVNPPVMALTALTAAMVIPVTGRGWRHGLFLIFVAALGVWGVWAYVPLHRGIELGNKNDWPAAQRELELAVQRDPLSTWAKLQAAYAAHRVGDVERAMVLYQSALTHEPGYALNWLNLAAAQWTAGDRSAALEALAHARSLAPEMEPVAIAERAWQGRTESSTMTEDIRLDLQIAQVMGGRLEVSFLEAERERLLAEFNTNRITAARVVQMAEIELARGDQTRAEYLLRYAEAMREAGAPELLFARGDLMAARGELGLATECYERAWHLRYQPRVYGDGPNYGWLLFLRESLEENMPPELKLPPSPALIERWRTLAAWYRASGRSEAAQGLEAQIAEWGAAPGR